MLSKADKYRQMIQNATKRIKLFPNADNQEKKPTLTFQRDIKLPSSHPFRSSEQIENNNMPITHHIARESSQQYTIIPLNNNWPKSCIGLVLCQHHSNNQIYYVYGTGILIHRKLVLTSAQNVYCHRLNIQYTNIRFIVGVCGDKCSGIYNVMRVYYPKEYTIQEYDNYNFTVLQLYNDLSDNYGYVGLKTLENKEEDDKYTVYGYISSNQQGSFNLKSQSKHGKQSKDSERCLRSGVLLKEKGYKYYIVGLQHLQRKDFMSEKIRNRINQWTEQTQINLANKNIDAQGCKHLSQGNWLQLNTIYLSYNKIGAQGCKYLSQVNWTHLSQIYLNDNNIGAQGCKYLSQANWTHLNTIYLSYNKIGAQGCKYLSQANWKHLTTIQLYNNNISGQGCKYLSQVNWIHLNTIDLYNNNIDIIYRLLLQQSYPITTIQI